MRLLPKKENEIKDEKLFREIISAGFVQKRKTILNNLKNAPPELKAKFVDVETLLADCKIDSQRRAETLTIEEWESLVNSVYLSLPTRN